MLPSKDIVAVSIHIESHENIVNNSACEVKEHNMYDKNGHPVANSLADLRLGVLDREFECLTCRYTVEDCPGHTGHIVLNWPVYHVSYLQSIFHVLSSVCHSCSRLLLLPDDPYLAAIARIGKHDKRLRELSKRCLGVDHCPHKDCGKAQRVYSQHRLNILCFERKIKPKKVRAEKKKTFKSPKRKPLKDVLVVASLSLGSQESRESLDETDSDRDDESQIDESEDELELEIESEAEVETETETELEVEDDSEGIQSDADTDTEREESVQMDAETIDESERQSAKKGLGCKARRDICTSQIDFTPHDALGILKGIDDELLDILSFSPGTSRPENAILLYLTVPSPRVRAPMVSRSGARSDGEITNHLKGIIKDNIQIAKYEAKHETAKASEGLSKLRDALQRDVAAYFHNGSNGTNKVMTRSGNPSRSLTDKLNGKTGRVRGTLKGKRMNLCARTVNGPGTDLDIDEVGIPEFVAIRIPVREVVNEYNINDLQQRVNIGPRIIGGASAIVRNGNDIDLRYSKHKRCQLVLGDIVKRYLKDGDIIIVNRQPTLHRGSIVCARARIHSSRTVLLSLAAMKTLNADCDGDELLLMVPQTPQAIAECMSFMMVHHQICDAQERASIGIVQDPAIMGFIGTRADVILDESEMARLAYELRNRSIGSLPIPAFEVVHPHGTDGIGRSTRTKFWTGKQAVSMALPSVAASIVHLPLRGNDHGDIERKDLPARFKRVNVRKGNKAGSDADDQLIIIDSELVSGRFNKAAIGPTGGSLCQAIRNDFGSEAARIFLSDLQRMLNVWISIRGFGMSLSDCSMGDQTRIRSIVDRAIAYISKHGKDMSEECIQRLLGAARDYSGGVTIHDPDYASNRMGQIIDSGAKGSRINLAQTYATLGQTILDGTRVKSCYSGNRSLPHFERDSFNPTGRGFIRQGFLEGLDAPSNYFHAMAGREGLVDTSSKTAKVGYINRRMIRAGEDVRTHQDQTVRLRNQVISFAMGGDAMEASRVEVQPYPLLTMPSEEIANKYGRQYQETSRLVEDALFLRNAKLRHSSTDLDPILRAPVAFHRILASASCVAQGPRGRLVTLPELRWVVDELVKWCESQIACEARLDAFFALLRLNLHPRNILEWKKLDTISLEWVCSEIRLGLLSSLVPSGEMVGIIAAQSIGEPCQQMTFNTFHSAGWGIGSVVAAIPQIENCIMVWSNGAGMELFARDASQIENSIQLARDLECVLLRDIATSILVLFDPDPYTTCIAQDADLVKEYAEVLDQSSDFKHPVSSLVLRIELDRKRCIRVGHTPQSIFALLSASFPGNHQWVVSPMCAKDQWIIRLRARKTSTKYQQLASGTSRSKASYSRAVNKALKVVKKPPPATAAAGKKSAAASGASEIKVFSNIASLFGDLPVHGIPGLSKIAIRRQAVHNVASGAKSFEYCVVTQGSDLARVLQLPTVDPARVFSTDLQDIQKTLGIEATFNGLVLQIARIFKQNDTYVSDRHLGVLASIMCRSGVILGLARYGFHSDHENGFLARCAFECTVPVLTEAARLGQVDTLEGIGGNIMTGSVMPIGTNSVDVVVDVDHYTKMVQKAMRLGYIDLNRDQQDRGRRDVMPPLEPSHLPQMAPFLYQDKRFMSLVSGYEAPSEYKQRSISLDICRNSSEIVSPDYSRLNSSSSYSSSMTREGELASSGIRIRSTVHGQEKLVFWSDAGEFKSPLIVPSAEWISIVLLEEKHEEKQQQPQLQGRVTAIPRLPDMPKIKSKSKSKKPAKK